MPIFSISFCDARCSWIGLVHHVPSLIRYLVESNLAVGLRVIRCLLLPLPVEKSASPCSSSICGRGKVGTTVFVSVTSETH